MIKITQRIVPAVILSAALLVFGMVEQATAQTTVTLLSETFEGFFPQDNAWNLDGSPTWNDVNSLPYQGAWSGYCAGSDRLIGPYDANMDAWMYYGPFSLADALSATITLMHTYDTEPNYDFVKYTVSIDGINFPVCQEFSGANLAWTQVTIDLTSTPLGNLCGQSQVWFAIGFVSDSSIQQEGAYVDNILIQKIVPSPTIRVEPDTDYGPVETGSTVGMPITIHNDGQLPLHVTGITCPSGFTGDWSGTVAAGGSQDVTIRFQPTQVMAYDGTLTVASDSAGGDNSCYLSGTGILPQTRIIRVTGSLAFGNVQVGSSDSLVFTIHNDGNAILHVDSLTPPTAFTASWSGDIAPSGSHDVSATFTPPSENVFGGYIVVNCNATSGTNGIMASGQGVPVPTRIIRLTGDMAFGSVAVGSSLQKTLTIHNDGNSALSITGIAYPTCFSGNWSSGTISAGGSRNITVTFSPSAIMAYSGTITVTSDATSGGNTSSATGTGTPVPDTQKPLISISSPTTASTYASPTNRLNIGGAASDNVSVAQVTIRNNRDVAGYICTGTTTWQFNHLPLFQGMNYLDAIATDAAGNSSTDTLQVAYYADTAYADILRSSTIIQEVTMPDSLLPGQTVTVQWKVLSYLPIRSVLGTKGDFGGTWTLYKNGIFCGVEDSTWHIGSRYASAYSFECDYTVPQKPGDITVWFAAAQMDGMKYMSAVIPDGVDSRPHPTTVKALQRTILPGGTSLDPQSDAIYWDSVHPFETSLEDYKKRSGGTLIDVDLGDNVVAGSVVTSQWKVLSYIDIQSKMRFWSLSEDREIQLVDGGRVGSPTVSPNWQFVHNGVTNFAMEYTFRSVFTMTNAPGIQQVYFVNKDTSGKWWMSANIPVGVDSRPVEYEGMYGRFIERTIVMP